MTLFEFAIPLIALAVIGACVARLHHDSKLKPVRIRQRTDTNPPRR